jgi:hypothetical protein
MPFLYVVVLESLKKNWQPVNVIDALPVFVIVSVFVPQKVPVGQLPPKWRRIVLGLKVRVTGTTARSGDGELEGPADATPNAELALTAKTNGAPPIASKNAIEAIRVEVSETDFMLAPSSPHQY